MSNKGLDLSLLANVFEERAENLSKTELQEWNVKMPHEQEVLAKLKGPGAKLLSGPRGSGKSTLLRLAYFDLLESEIALPVYVNYSKSMALEPLFHRRADALQLFRQWLLAKILIGFNASLSVLQQEVLEEIQLVTKWANSVVNNLETGKIPELDQMMTPTGLNASLEKWSNSYGRKRCVLLLDDAAHAFSSEQQREFFEVFRSLRSRAVSAKAAVYPGVTSYSPNFHVGHEAELIEAWCDPNGASYTDVMRQIFRLRITEEFANKLKGKEEIIDILALASFGIPRAFLNMLSMLLGIDEGEGEGRRPTVQLAEKAIVSQSESIRGVFSSLSKKLPRYNKFIIIGQELDSKLLALIRDYNYKRDPSDKATSIAIADPLEPEFLKIISFMEYAGLVRKMPSFNRGNRGVYQRFMVHYSLLLADRALNLGKADSIKNQITSFVSKSAHAIPHTRSAALLSKGFEGRCVIDLAPCQKCDYPRLSEDARFCMKCGAQLKDQSVYEELLRTSVKDLPLTKHKIEGLLQSTSIRSVQDILMDEESREIRKAPLVGPFWSKRIHNAAEEFISV